MRRHGSVGCALLLTACQSNPYFIGRFRDTACESHADAILCSGFEQADLSDWSGPIVDGAASVRQTTTAAHRGTGALLAESHGQESDAVVDESFAPITSGDVYLRVDILVPAGSPTKTMNILFIGDYATPDPFKGIDFNLESDAPQIYVPESTPQRFTSTTATIPRDRWFCLQIHVGLSKTAGVVDVSIDGTTALAQSGLDTLPDAGIHLLRAGIDWSSLQSEPFTLYMDDLVLATAPVDCD